MLTGLFRKALSNAYYVERYVLSFAYLFLAWREFHSFLEPLVLRGTASAAYWSQTFVPLVKHTNLLLLQLFVGILLLTNPKPSRQPQNLGDVAIPLVASFFSFGYSLLPLFPEPWQRSLLSAGVQMPCAVAGLVLGLAGPALATWAIMILGRSFGIFIAVREIVMHGPYRYVRHPIYLGYVCMLAGLVLANLSVAIFLIVPVHIALLLYRALLEEARLAESSAEYREYIKRTGFIFPRFR